MLRRIATASILVAGLLAFNGASAVGVGVYGTEGDCGRYVGEGTYPRIALYGSDNFQGGGGLFLCDGPGIPDLNKIYQDSNDNCAGVFGVDFGRFDNCISSYNAAMGSSGWAVCLYTGINYGGSKHKTSGGYITDMGGTLNGFDDAVSSIKWIPNSQSC